ncbi:MAG: hypothetical protein L0G87_08115 [Renibacterium salmoninarum]|nr:hypothetical protein [Renibacterium salmoninarum]
MTIHQGRLPIPYPLEISGSVLADRPGFALAVEGIGVSDAGVSFSIHVLTTLLGHPREAQALLDTAWPFCGPESKSDSTGLTVRCQWRYANNSEWDSDTGLRDAGETPVVGSSWSWNSPERAEGHYTLHYPMNPATAEEIKISVSWATLGFDSVVVQISKEAISAALQLKSH